MIPWYLKANADPITLTGRTRQQVTVEMHHTLWLRIYLAALIAFCRIVGQLPDNDRLYRMVERGSRFRIVAGAETSGFFSLRDFHEAKNYTVG